jgi:hypothetical protein
LVRGGLRSIGVGLALFVGFGLVFEGVIGLSGEPLLTGDAGPYVLIGAGAVLLALGLFRRGRSA